MTDRPMRFAMERPVEFWFTDIRDPRRFRGRTLNISSGGVLVQTEEQIGVGRKIEMVVRMATLTPDNAPVDLRLLGRTVRSGQGWVAAQIKKYQILPHPQNGPAETRPQPISARPS
ncbi:MAG: hypothetical protein HY236_13175 [Acidobacteria bacterium]|nr:hypothetical protein [Acidobacteriota bacterium]